MSFGFSVGDFLAGLRLANHIVEAIRSGPSEYQELQDQTESMQSVFKSLSRDAAGEDSLLNCKGAPRKAELMELVERSQATMHEVKQLIEKHSRLKSHNSKNVARVWDAYAVGATDVAALCGRMTFHVTAISAFLVSLQGSALARIEQKVDALFKTLTAEESIPPEATESTASLESKVSILSEIDTDEAKAWTLLKDSLVGNDISIEQVLAHREGIVCYMKTLLERSVEYEEHTGGTTLGTLRTWRDCLTLSLDAVEYVIYDDQKCTMIILSAVFEPRPSLLNRLLPRVQPVILNMRFNTASGERAGSWRPTVITNRNSSLSWDQDWSPAYGAIFIIDTGIDRRARPGERLAFHLPLVMLLGDWFASRESLEMTLNAASSSFEPIPFVLKAAIPLPKVLDPSTQCGRVVNHQDLRAHIQNDYQGLKEVTWTRNRVDHH